MRGWKVDLGAASRDSDFGSWGARPGSCCFHTSIQERGSFLALRAGLLAVRIHGKILYGFNHVGRLTFGSNEDLTEA
jgi:hypothetical protein